MTELNIISGVDEIKNESTNNEEIAPTTITSVRVKTPKRILHFSDGTLEEYSEDETDVTDNRHTHNDKQIDVKRLEWGPWMIHRALHTGNRVLAACDYVGERIASFLGITTPKYSYEIEQFKRIQEERAKENDEETRVGGWMQATNEANVSNDKNKTATEPCITSQETLKRY